MTQEEVQALRDEAAANIAAHSSPDETLAYKSLQLLAEITLELKQLNETLRQSSSLSTH